MIYKSDYINSKIGLYPNQIEPSSYTDLPLGIGCIYSIIDDNVLYAGSTCCIRERIRKHISYCINPNSTNYNYKLYQYIRDHGGIHHFKFKILEYVENQEDLINREQYYYDKLRPPLNMIRPRGLPQAEYSKQYYEQNKETILEYQKQYYEQNKEKLNEQHKQYYQLNKERFNQKHTCKICSGFYTKSHKAEHEKSNKHQRALSQSQQ